MKLEISDSTGAVFAMYADGNILVRGDSQQIALIADLLSAADKFIAECRDTKPVEFTLLDGILHPRDSTHVSLE